MATPTVSSSAGGSAQVTLSTLSASYTSNTDPLYFLLITPNTVNFFSVNYGGVQMWKVAEQSGGGWTFELWTLDAPASGAANFTAIADSITFVYGYFAFNVNGGPAPHVMAPYIETITSGSSTAPTITITNGRTGDLTLGAVVSDISNQTFTDAGGQTNIVSHTAANTRPHGSLSSVAGGASVAVAFTLGTTDAWAMIGIVIADPGGAATVGRVSRDIAEVIDDGTKTGRVSRMIAEAVNDGTRTVRVSRIIAEVVTVHRFPALTLAK